MRPQAANECSEYGHWEMNTVVGTKGSSSACLLVLTERMSRDQIIRKITARTQKAVLRARNQLEREEHERFKYLKTITANNGGEFLDIEGIERSIDQ